MFAAINRRRAIVLFAETLREMGVLVMVFVPLDGWLAPASAPAGGMVAAFCLGAACTVWGIFMEART